MARLAFAVFEFPLFIGIKFDAKCVHNTLAEAFAGIESEKFHLNEATYPLAPSPPLMSVNAFGVEQYHRSESRFRKFKRYSENMFVQLCGNYNGTSCNSRLDNSSKLSLSASPYTTGERSSKIGSKGEAMDRHLAHARLGVISFGLAIGLVWALSVVLLAVMAAAFDWGIIFAAALQNLYIGFGPNFVGAIAGAVWGFVHGFLFGILIAFFYNRLLSSRYVHHFEQQDEIER